MCNSIYHSDSLWKILFCGICIHLLLTGCGTHAKHKSGSDEYRSEHTVPDLGFSYRSIYSPTGLNPDRAARLKLNNFDADWGIWGHNLKKLVANNGDKVLYATIHGAKDASQLCFSSDKLYQLVESYIIDNFGESPTTRIVVAPTDSPAACTCERCRQLGNTPNNSTPAVTWFAEKLASRFPSHRFFILSYLSTELPPDHSLPANVGVLISAMTLPFCLVGEKEECHSPFAQQLTLWKSVTHQIYVWDYINNFDDYLTPFPILKIARQRLLFYKKNRIEGVFLNGSGYLYSSFDDLKTSVLAALLNNPNQSIDKLVREFLEQEYPVSKEWIYHYYMQLEERMPTGKPFNLYMGSDELKQLYFSGSCFFEFFEGLNTFIEQAVGHEREKLQLLHTALSFTGLELMRMYDGQSGKHTKNWIRNLNRAVSDGSLTCYSESEQTLLNYLNDWKLYIDNSDVTDNLLAGIMPQVTMPAGKEMPLSSSALLYLTDGIHGLPSNYHCGWTILPANDVSLDFFVTDMPAKGILKCSFLQMPRHHIYAPLEIDIYTDNMLCQRVKLNPADLSEKRIDGKGKMVKKSIPLSLDGVTHLTVRLMGPDSNKGQIGIDEIAYVK
ncbi:MAG: DUF4838 domain-containing protein [Prevotellaceae bacterium]|jgi:hypothetical protein|nr:DUF4838 domain-containing protein [Prevotellaceae bacterium]